jgi:hypothetical protein
MTMYRGVPSSSAHSRRNLCSAVVAILTVLIGFALVAPGIARAGTPALALSPATGSPGTAETVTGSGWPAGDLIFVQIGSTTFDSDVVCALTANSSGMIAAANGCPVPNVAHGSQPLVAIDDQQQSITFDGSFAVTAGFSVTPANASAGAATSPGTVVTAVGHGFAPNSTVSKFKFDGVAVTTSPTSVSTDANGNAAPVTFTIPSTATVGANTLTATDASGFVGTQTIPVYLPTVALTPASGSPGTVETITGSGWPAGDLIFVQIGSTTFDSDVVCALTASSSGTIAGVSACVVPDVAHGSEPLVAIDDQQQGVVYHSTFAVSGGFAISPANAGVGAATSPGTVVTAVGHGFAPFSTVSKFKFDGVAVTTSPTSVSTDANGNASPVTFTIPSTATVGANTLTATDASGFVGTQTIPVYRVKLTLTPATGAPGKGETITGSNWPAGDLIFVQIGSTTFDSDVVCALTASSSGTIAGSGTNGCVVPNVQHGSEPLVAIDDQQQGVVYHSTYAVTPGFSISPANAAVGAATSPGTVVTAVGHGFAPNSTVSKFKFDGAVVTTSPTSVSTDANGNASPVTFKIPASATVGTNTLTATDASGFVGTQKITVYRVKLALTPASGAPGAVETVTGSGWPAGDLIFVQIGSTTFDSDVVCALTANSSGAIAGANGCTVPSVATGTLPLVAIDDQQQGVVYYGTFKVT